MAENIPSFAIRCVLPDDDLDAACEAAELAVREGRVLRLVIEDEPAEPDPDGTVVLKLKLSPEAPRG